MQNYSPQRFSTLPPVIKNLLIINGLFFLASMAFTHVFNYDLVEILGLHYPQSDSFRPLQLVSYMFMHADFTHVFFNMFALWMFGNVLENIWGPKRFLAYYFVTGIGAALTHLLVTYLRIQNIISDMDPEMVQTVLNDGVSVLNRGMNYSHSGMASLNLLLNTPTVGASGSVFGILLAFGMMFPNSIIYLYFAIPVKAKWFVIGYGAIELFGGVMNSQGDNVAHFAHLGGMVFGFFMIRYWQKQRRMY